MATASRTVSIPMNPEEEAAEGRDGGAEHEVKGIGVQGGWSGNASLAIWT